MKDKIRLVILSALPASAINTIAEYELLPLKRISEVRERIPLTAEIGEVISYIRHPATQKIIRQFFSNVIEKPNEQYVLDPNDYILLIGLKKRLPKGITDVEVSEEDLALALLRPLPPCYH